MPSVFICYNWQDKEFARLLATKLRDNGVMVWFDEGELRVGDSLTKKIPTAIKESDYVAAVLSNNSVSSNWVRKELAIAMDQEIEGKRIKVLPILKEKCKIPEAIENKLYADFTNPEKFDTSFSKLIKSMYVLGEKQEDHIISWINKHWQGKKNCPVCENNDWIIPDNIYELNEMGEHRKGTPSIVPLIQMTCNVCGHTLLFNALKIGVKIVR